MKACTLLFFAAILFCWTGRVAAQNDLVQKSFDPLRTDPRIDSIHVDESNPPYARVIAGLGRSSISFGAIAIAEFDFGGLVLGLRRCIATEFFPDHGPPVSVEDLSLTCGFQLIPDFGMYRLIPV